MLGRRRRQPFCDPLLIQYEQLAQDLDVWTEQRRCIIPCSSHLCDGRSHQRFGVSVPGTVLGIRQRYRSTIKQDAVTVPSGVTGIAPLLRGWRSGMQAGLHSAVGKSFRMAMDALTCIIRQIRTECPRQGT